MRMVASLTVKKVFLMLILAKVTTRIFKMKMHQMETNTARKVIKTVSSIQMRWCMTVTRWTMTDRCYRLMREKKSFRTKNKRKLRNKKQKQKALSLHTKSLPTCLMGILMKRLKRSIRTQRLAKNVPMKIEKPTSRRVDEITPVEANPTNAIANDFT